MSYADIILPPLPDPLQEGRDDYAAGRPITDNPWVRYTDAWSDWRHACLEAAGWPAITEDEQ